jgi:hypothetical protein
MLHGAEFQDALKLNLNVELSMRPNQTMQNNPSRTITQLTKGKQIGL